VLLDKATQIEKSFYDRAVSKDNYVSLAKETLNTIRIDQANASHSQSPVNPLNDSSALVVDRRSTSNSNSNTPAVAMTMGHSNQNSFDLSVPMQANTISSNPDDMSAFINDDFSDTADTGLMLTAPNIALNVSSASTIPDLNVARSMSAVMNNPDTLSFLQHYQAPKQTIKSPDKQKTTSNENVGQPPSFISQSLHAQPTFMQPTSPSFVNNNLSSQYQKSPAMSPSLAIQSSPYLSDATKNQLLVMSPAQRQQYLNHLALQPPMHTQQQPHLHMQQQSHYTPQTQQQQFQQQQMNQLQQINNQQAQVQQLQNKVSPTVHSTSLLVHSHSHYNLSVDKRANPKGH